MATQLGVVGGLLAKIGDNSVNIPALARQIGSRGGVVPFVGAGMSIPLGFRGWGDFLIAQSPDGESRHRIKAHLELGRFEEAAEDLLTRLGANRFQASLEQEFGPARLPRERLRCALECLPSLSSGPVLTTNFDHVLERIFAEAERPFSDVILGMRLDQLRDAFHQRRHVLVKLHGDATDRQDRVLTWSDYERRYSEREPLRAVLRFALTQPLLFLGCSLRQDRVVRVLADVSRELHGQQAEALQLHYALVEQPASVEVFRARQNAFADLGLRPIWYPPGRHDLIRDLLVELREGVCPRSPVSSVPPRQRRARTFL